MNAQRTKLAEEDAQRIGRAIRAVRRARRASQGQFAAEVGVSQQKLSEWERGKRLGIVVVSWRLAEILGGAR
jgi:transcriptional regulator with XRE-family HTH domain